MFKAIADKLIGGNDVNDPKIRKKCGLFTGITGIAVNVTLCTIKIAAGLISSNVYGSKFAIFLIEADISSIATIRMITETPSAARQVRMTSFAS